MPVVVREEVRVVKESGMVMIEKGVAVEEPVGVMVEEGWVLEQLMVMELVEVELPVVEMVEPVMVEATGAEMRSPTAMVAKAGVHPSLPCPDGCSQRKGEKGDQDD